MHSENNLINQREGQNSNDEILDPKCLDYSKLQPYHELEIMNGEDYDEARKLFEGKIPIQANNIDEIQGEKMLESEDFYQVFQIFKPNQLCNVQQSAQLVNEVNIDLQSQQKSSRNKPQNSRLQKLHQNRWKPSKQKKKRPHILAHNQNHPSNRQNLLKGDPILQIGELIFEAFKILEKHVNFIFQHEVNEVKEPILVQKKYKRVRFQRGDRKFRDMKLFQFLTHFKIIVKAIEKGGEGSWQDNIRILLTNILRSQDMAQFLCSLSFKFKVNFYNNLLKILKRKNNKQILADSDLNTQRWQQNHQSTDLRIWLMSFSNEYCPDLVSNLMQNKQKNKIDEPNNLQNIYASNQLNEDIIPEPNLTRKFLNEKTKGLYEQQKIKFEEYQIRRKIGQKFNNQEFLQQILLKQEEEFQHQDYNKEEDGNLKKHKQKILILDENEESLIEDQKIVQVIPAYVKSNQKQRKSISQHGNEPNSNLRLRKRSNENMINNQDSRSKTLKINQPNCFNKKCKKQLENRKCSFGNHSIIICPQCNWSQHKCSRSQYELKSRQSQFYRAFNLISKGQHLKKYDLPRLIPVNFKNNIKEVVQSQGYTFVQHSTIISSTPKQFQCLYPILPTYARNQIFQNRAEQTYLPLTIKQSSIPGAGLGVFTTDRIPLVGTLVCSYLGDTGLGSQLPVSKKYWNGIRDNDSVYTLGWLEREDILVICPDKYSNVGRFINYNQPQKCNLKPGIALLQLQSDSEFEISLFLTTTRIIEAGEELFYNYGPEYSLY